MLRSKLFVTTHKYQWNISHNRSVVCKPLTTAWAKTSQTSLPSDIEQDSSEKRITNPYHVHMQNAIPALKAQYSGKTNQDCFNMAAAQYKSLPDAVKQAYKEQADMARAKSKTPRGKAASHRNRAAHGIRLGGGPRSAYNVHMEKAIPLMKQQYPGKTHKECFKMAAAQFKSLTDATKQAYKEQAEAARAECAAMKEHAAKHEADKLERERLAVGYRQFMLKNQRQVRSELGPQATNTDVVLALLKQWKQRCEQESPDSSKSSKRKAHAVR